MSTAPGDNEPTERAPGTDPETDGDPAGGAAAPQPEGNRPRFAAHEEDTGIPFAGPDEDPAAPGEPQAPAEDRAAAEATAPPERGRRRGLSEALSAETFALTALVLVVIPLISGQLPQLLATVFLIGGQPIAVEQARQLSIQILVSGAPAVVSAAVAGLSLVLAGVRTRPWARWAAAASLIVSLLLVVVAVVAYVLVPEGTQLPPPPFGD
ncbi:MULTISPECIES: hypothetical protein [unclassified Nocardiopsis]|uniref:hypothetical protein n=1 Tax=unclassified Nocardiopsis TaxID=2649073 RepID=UPI00135C6706|nr:MULTISPECIES: hypothetical protein [unclassified Nocardiopsis]